MSSQTTIFTTAEARKAGLTKREIKGLIEAGQLIRLSRGLYMRSDKNSSQQGICEPFESATLLLGRPSAICLYSALEFHKIPPQQNIKQTWIMVPFSKRCSHDQIRVFRSRNPFWDIGIQQYNEFSVTSLERTLVEMISNPKSIPLEDGIHALKFALKNHQTDLHKIISIGGKLRRINRISELIKMFSLLD